ncbi:MAG: glycosyltransferase [Planctomycetes bacterium]|nr:glycosyltransferase [Planctomycetota bacterium]
MEKTKKISIIIPAFNEEEHLPSCLESIANLDYPKSYIEIVVVDNGSTDSTKEIARRFGAKVLCDGSLNVSGLRNLGVAESSGEIITFVDADCVVQKEWLKRAERYFDDLNIAAWGSPPVPPVRSTWVQKTWFLIRKKTNQVQEVDWLESMNLFVRKELFTAIGGFNKSLVTCEDVDFCYRIRECGTIVSDSRIEVVHLGEAATIKEFMRKETWRGKSNLSGIFAHGFRVKEIPSLFLPLYFGIFIPGLLLFSFLSFDPRVVLTAFILYVTPSFFVLYKVIGKKANGVDLLRLLFLSQFYFLARTLSLVKRA